MGQLIRSESSLVKSGSYSYVGDDGIPITTSWVADEMGFRATGAHLPVPVEPLPLAPVESYGGSYDAVLPATRFLAPVRSQYAPY